MQMTKVTEISKKSISKDRFIPFRKQDIINLCCEHGTLNDEQRISFSQLCTLLQSLIHFEFHQTLETLKDSYAPFNPHADTKQLNTIDDSQKNHLQQQFANTFKQVLNAANFEQVTNEDLAEALHEESLFKVRLEVEFDDFEQVVFYRRGEYVKTVELAQWWNYRKKTFSFTNYDRVAVYIKFKNADYFAKKNRQANQFKPGSTIIKLFQDVPKADLEMLFPNSQVRMRPIDKAIIGGSAIVGGSVVLVTKLGASIVLLGALLSFWLGLTDKQIIISQHQLIALGLGLGVFSGFIFKQWSKFKNRKLAFMKALADNLYFKNLDNNAGVFHRLVDNAEEEECKEMILAYYFLLTSTEPLSKAQLDNLIEQWFVEKHQVELDFEVDDALAKLGRMGLITQTDEKFHAIPLMQAKNSLDSHWDNLFDYNQRQSEN
jgi:hypothetical protein